jgi:hypothetical protein
MDWDTCLRRHRARDLMRWNRRDLDGRWGTHNRIVDGDALERWFYEDSGLTEWPVTPERIPARWADLV